MGFEIHSSLIFFLIFTPSLVPSTSTSHPTMRCLLSALLRGSGQTNEQSDGWSFFLEITQSSPGSSSASSNFHAFYIDARISIQHIYINLHPSPLYTYIFRNPSTSIHNFIQIKSASETFLLEQQFFFLSLNLE